MYTICVFFSGGELLLISISYAGSTTPYSLPHTFRGPLGVGVVGLILSLISLLHLGSHSVDRMLDFACVIFTPEKKDGSPELVGL